MENNQSTQQQSSELSDSQVAQSGQPLEKPAGRKSLLELLKSYPWLLWSGLWVFLLAITAIAIFSLIHTTSMEKEQPEPTHVTADKSAKTSSQTANPIPLWLLGAVVVSCAAGSLVFYKWLKNPSRPHKRVKRSSAQLLKRRQQRQKQLQESLPVPTPLEPLPPVAPVLAETEPEVTVLPPEESHLLDSGEESLAEMMDIRKQRPLSEFLRDP